MRSRSLPSRPRARRAALGVVVGAGLVLVVVALLLPLRDESIGAPAAVVLILPVVAAAVVGGAIAALTTALVATAALNLVFVVPYGSLKVAEVEGVLELLAFLLVAVVVSVLVAAETRRRRQAEDREEQLRDLNGWLEELLAERTRLVERAGLAEDLELREMQRSSLLRSVSHDLRTPLSAIRAVATDMRDGVEYDDATRVELFETVCDEVDRLDRMVSNLLSMSRIEAGAYEPQRQAVDVHELVDERLRSLRPLLRHVRPTTRIPDDLPLVDGDYPQLQQLLTNLLANAARHAPRDTEVWVVAKVVGPTDAPMVQVEVSDRGDGVAEADRDRVFEPFTTGPGSTSSGVGLAICRAIVDAHGGSIHVERTFGGGATFVLTLPVHATAAVRV